MGEDADAGPIATSPHGRPANSSLQCPPLPSRPASQFPPPVPSPPPTVGQPIPASSVLPSPHSQPANPPSSPYYSPPTPPGQPLPHCSLVQRLEGGPMLQSIPEGRQGGGGGWKEAPCSRAYLRGGKREREEGIQGRGGALLSSQASRCSIHLSLQSLQPPPSHLPCRPLTRVSRALSCGSRAGSGRCCPCPRGKSRPPA